MTRAPFVFACIALFSAGVLPAQTSTAAARPNVVFIVTDDAGYGDLGCFGATDLRTPHIDRLAREGVRMTDFYAQPQCTPTRAAFISGRYQQRVGLERALGTGPTITQGLNADGTTLPRLLKHAGYATALFGKWHLGYEPQHSPNAHGFDTFFGLLSGYHDFYAHTRGDGKPDLFENERPAEVEGYTTDLITARATQFIDQQARAPFFLMVSYNAPHWPFQPPGRPSRAARNGQFQGAADATPATRADYVAMLERVDDGVGQIVGALARHGLAGNTLVIYTQDNGGEWLSRNTPLFHRKDTLWEGGIRVPAILRWPARLPAGRTSGQAGITMDLTATILAAAGAAAPAGAPKPDGLDLLPLISGEKPEVERTLFWRINTPTRQQWAVRSGDWKLLIDGDDLMLFNVRIDLGERNELAAGRSEIVAKLRPLITAWEAEVGRAPGATGTTPGAPAPAAEKKPGA